MKKASSAGFFFRLKKDLYKNWYFYIMLIPVLLFYIIFCYFPMYGAIIAFKDYKPALGFLDSPWVGMEYFMEFFQAHDFWKLIRNTLMISFYSLIFAFPAPHLHYFRYLAGSRVWLHPLSGSDFWDRYGTV